MNKTNISEIESFLYGILKGKVSQHVYVSTFPSIINKKWNEMCLVDSSSITDMDAYGQGIVLLYLYARPNSDGTKNVAVMNELENRLDEVLQNYPCGQFYLSRKATYNDFDNQLQWHTNIVEIVITIV